MDVSAQPVGLAAVFIAGAIAAWLKFRLGRGDQFIRIIDARDSRIAKLEEDMAALRTQLDQVVELKIENAVLRAENLHLVDENDALRSQTQQRRRGDVVT